MKVTIITVGKKHDKNLDAVITEYEKRLRHYCDLEWVYIPSSDIATESSAILRAVESYEFVALLDERGLDFSSPQLAESIERSQNSSYKKIAIIIGGAYGVNASVSNRASVVLRLTRLVLPHQIVRLIVVEQLYRAYSILAGSDYHHS